MKPLIKVNSGAPEFDGIEKFEEIQVEVGKRYVFTAPAVTDPDGDKYKMTISGL